MQQLDTVRILTPTARPAIPDRAPIVLGVIGAAVGFAGSWIPSYWGDEAASVMSASRPWPSLFALLGHVDGVHGLYYAILHVWVDVFGASELATRALSAIAVGLMVSGTVVLARRFVGARVAMWAGVIAILLPRTTFMAGEARSYALGAAAAVWVTVLLVHLVRDAARLSRRVWFAYALTMALSMYLFLYLGLLLLVHGAFVALLHRAALRRWAWAAGSAVVLAAPILVIGYRERTQIRFLKRRHYATAAHVLTTQWFGYSAFAVIGWLLVLCAIAGAVLMLRRRDDHRSGTIALTFLAGLWLIIPTAVLLIVDATVAPVYSARYLSFCTPAVAILMALGVAAVAGTMTRPRRLIVAGAILCAVAILSAPPYVGQRTPWAKDGGSDLRAVAEAIQAHATPGSAVVFDQSTKPSRDPRLALDLYPESFAGLRDVGLVTPYVNRGRLWDRTMPIGQAAALATASADIWAVELPTAGALPADVALLEDLGYEVESSQLIHRATVYHLVRE